MSHIRLGISNESWLSHSGFILMGYKTLKVVYGSSVKIFSNFGYWWLHLANVKRQLEQNYLHLKWCNQRFVTDSFTKKENCIWTVTDYVMQSMAQSKMLVTDFLHVKRSWLPRLHLGLYLLCDYGQEHLDSIVWREIIK